MSIIPKIVRAGGGALGLIAFFAIASGCSSISETPHAANPSHWNTHFQQVFGWKDGAVHRLHIDIDRVFLGVENYAEYEETEIVYSE